MEDGVRCCSRPEGLRTVFPTGQKRSKNKNLSLIFKLDGDRIWTVRLDQRPGGRAIVRLVAIATDVQMRGHGAVLLQHIERLALSLGIGELLVHSAPDAVGFYLKSGFERFDFEAGDFNSVHVRKMIE